MNLLLFLPLAFPFACLALLSSIAFLGVVVIAGAFHVVRATRTAISGPASRGDDDQWHGMVGEAHPLDFIEGQPQ